MLHPFLASVPDSTDHKVEKKRGSILSPFGSEKPVRLKVQRPGVDFAEFAGKIVILRLVNLSVSYPCPEFFPQGHARHAYDAAPYYFGGFPIPLRRTDRASSLCSAHPRNDRHLFDPDHKVDIRRPRAGLTRLSSGDGEGGQYYHRF
jgi:hypothetical protein